MKKILILINFFNLMTTVSLANTSEIINCSCNNGGIGDYFANFIAFLNLIVIIYFYFKDLKIKKNENTKNYMFFWYQNYGLVEAMKYLNVHIELCNELIQELIEFCNHEKNTEKRVEFIKSNIISRFTQSNNLTKNRIDMVISAIGVKNKSDQFRGSFRKIQDLFTEETNKLDPAFDKIKNEIENIKIEIMNGLYILGTEEFLEKKKYEKSTKN